MPYSSRSIPPNRPMSVWKVGSIVLGWTLLLTPPKVLAGVGDLPVINSLQAIGTMGHNFNQAGSSVQVAIFMINNNHANGFDITFTFANRGKFIHGANEIAMTSILLDKMGIGTLGNGLTEPNNTVVTLDGAGSWLWNPGATQTTETSNYHVQLKASWHHPSGILAGYYYETVSATISIGL